MQVHSYEKLTVWQKAMDLVEAVYKETIVFPESEKYGLVSQMRRAAVSIPSNIAEGSRRSTKKDFRHFLIIAFGSGSELETQIRIAVRIGFLKKDSTMGIVLDEVMRMLNKLIESNND
ncbi:MAG: four helix bundle protein [Candidatus Yonathbacteria bacterium]|nr:four helix bundle protein [Candidatus Yonathbacteria bacterium]